MRSRWLFGTGTVLLIAAGCSGSEVDERSGDGGGGSAAPGPDTCSPCESGDDCRSAQRCVAFPSGERRCAFPSGTTECCDEGRTGTATSRHCEEFSATDGDAGSVDASQGGAAVGVGGATAGGGAFSGGQGGGPRGTGGAPPRGNGTIGASCRTAADCRPGFECMDALDDRVGGGVAGGVCTLDCSEDLNGNVDTCGPVGPNTVCVAFTDTTAFCFEACEVGDGRPAKCHGRVDLSCISSPPSVLGYCSPTCGGDVDCAGRQCDLASGLCVDALQGTLPPGSVCDADSPDPQCRAGLCLPIQSDAQGTVGLCSGFCSLGSFGCGQDPASPTPPTSLCAFPDMEVSALGDAGYCGKLCDCDGECGSPALVCDALPPELRSSVGRNGVCVGSAGADGGLLAGLPCP